MENVKYFSSSENQMSTLFLANRAPSPVLYYEYLILYMYSFEYNEPYNWKILLFDL